MAPSQIKELVEGDLPTLEKPLWVDEPKPVPNKKKAKKKAAKRKPAKKKAAKKKTAKKKTAKRKKK